MLQECLRLRNQDVRHRLRIYFFRREGQPLALLAISQCCVPSLWEDAMPSDVF